MSDYCAVTGYGNYIKKLSVFNKRGMIVQSGMACKSRDDAKRILDAFWFEEEASKIMDRYELRLRNSVFYGDREGCLPIIHTISGFGGYEWSAAFLSPRLYQDELEKNDNGNMVLAVTADGERIASIHEEEAERNENERLIARILAEEARGSSANRYMVCRAGLSGKEI